MLLVLLWLQSVDIKLFIQKKKIYIEDSKKGKFVSQISCSITTSEVTRFQANGKGRVNVDKT